MKNFNNLLIIGDSFCKDRNKESDWPVALSKLLGCKMYGRGRGGCSWWASRNDLNEYMEHRSSTILIVIHTEASRLPNDFNFAVNPGIAFTTAGSAGDDLKHNPKIRQVASDFYTSKLFSPAFYHWAQQCWINELDSSKDFYATLHIPAFNNVDLTGVKNGVVVTPGAGFKSLRDISNTEVGDVKWAGPDSRSNHFKDFNNVKFAEALFNNINNLPSDRVGTQTLDNMSDWDLTPAAFKHSAAYLNK